MEEKKSEINDTAWSYVNKIREDCKPIKPLVAIRCMTYNHEPYIRDALEGFVMQKTDFPFVAIVHDDASMDGTAAIIREYAKKYPDIIKPIYETENQYSKKDGSLSHIMNEACEATGAKYIAYCEGDDYWIDPLKLQKQVDFLESHPDYSMCCTDFDTLNEELKVIKNHKLTNHKVITFNNLVRESNLIGTLTVVIKAEIVNKFDLLDKPYWPLGDYPLWLFSTLTAPAYRISEVTSTYRVLNNSASHFLNQYDKFEFDLAVNEIRLYFAKYANSKVLLCKLAKFKYIMESVFRHKKVGLRELKYIIRKRYL